MRRRTRKLRKKDVLDFSDECLGQRMTCAHNAACHKLYDYNDAYPPSLLNSCNMHHPFFHKQKPILDISKLDVKGRPNHLVLNPLSANQESLLAGTSSLHTIVQGYS